MSTAHTVLMVVIARASTVPRFWDTNHVLRCHTLLIVGRSAAGAELRKTVPETDKRKVRALIVYIRYLYI